MSNKQKEGVINKLSVVEKLKFYNIKHGEALKNLFDLIGKTDTAYIYKPRIK